MSCFSDYMVALRPLFFLLAGMTYRDFTLKLHYMFKGSILGLTANNFIMQILQHVLYLKLI